MRKIIWNIGRVAAGMATRGWKGPAYGYCYERVPEQVFLKVVRELAEHVHHLYDVFFI